MRQKVVKKPVDQAGWERQESGRIRVSSLLTGLDLFVVEMEKKWGADRLRLLVPDDLREKFDRQRFLLRKAQHEGTVEDIERECARMRNAFVALDKAATAAGADQIKPEVWEATISDGRVVALVRDERDVQLVANRIERGVLVWSLADVLRLIEDQSFVNCVKESFPGTKIKAFTSSGAGMFDDLDEQEL